MELLLHFLNYALSFFVTLSVIVFIHEFGHYLVAKCAGVKIEAFSIGFGRELWGWNDRSGTRWKLSLLPLGGYVKMYGDASAASNADTTMLDTLSEEEKKRTFHHKPLWKKALIVAAGPFFNFLLTIGLLTYFIMTTGLPSTEPVVGQIMPDTPAQAAGLQAGDRVLMVGDKTVKHFNDIPYYIATNNGTPVTIAFSRNGKVMQVVLTPTMWEEKDILGNPGKRPLIGIKSPEITYEEAGFPRAVWEATVHTYGICVTTLEVLKQMVMGERGASELKGPLGIAKLSGQAADKGLNTILWLIAMLSANLGLVNLLPVPLLDGGHLAYYAAEAARGRPLAQKVQEYGYRVGLAIIVTLMVFTLYNDIRQMFFS